MRRNCCHNIAFVAIELFRPASSASALSNHQLVSTRRQQTKAHHHQRHLQLSDEEEYTCSGSSITTGEYRDQNSHLCYTNTNTNTNNEVSTFGLNSNGELVYIVNDELIWQATLSSTLPPPQTNDCIVFGRCENQMTLIRLAPNTGSLTGFDASRAKIWDSAIDTGSYIIDDDSDALNFMTSDGGNGVEENSSLTSSAAAAATTTTTKNTNCTLEITEFGVTITNEDTQQVIWRIVAPGAAVVVDTVTTDAPTNMPITTTATTTTQPTIAPTQSIVLVTTVPPTLLTSSESPVLLSTLVPTTTTTNIPSSISTISYVPTVTAGHIKGITFLDTNNNGQRDTVDIATTTEFEPNVPNIPIWLYTCSAPPIDVGDVIASNFVDSGSTLVAAARTDAIGEYNFDNLFAGYYRIQVLLPSEYTISSIWSGGTGGVSNNTNDIDPTTNSTPCFELLASAEEMSWDIGLVILNETATTSPIIEDIGTPTTSPAITAISSSQPVTIFGIVFDDSNNNGYFDIAANNETGVGNVQAALFTCDGGILLTTKTDDNGMYGFSDLSSGSYQVKFLPPEGYSFSSVWTGSNADVNNNADPATGSTVCQSYFPGDSENMLDVGMLLNSTATAIEEETGDGSLMTLQPLAGDGTPCSGMKCLVDGMCRNQAGLCGSGISFCNPFSVWDPTCTATANSTGIYSPSTTPSISLVSSLCNTDGSVGMTVFNNQSVQAIYFAFTYAIENSNNDADFDDLVTKFEMELNTRLACVYFIDNCLSCSDDESNDEIGSVRRRLMSLQQSRFMLTINNSSVAGISHLPTDEVNVMEVCANGSQTDCRVMDGQFTAYFPNDISLKVMESEREQMLVVVQDEIERTDFEGMRVSYDNAPFPTASTIVETNESVNSDNGNGGLSIGAIIGILVTCIILVAVIAFLVIRYKKEQEESAVVPESVQQSKQNGHDKKEYDSDFDGSSSSSGSLSSEDKDYELSESSMQSSMPDESAVSNDTFPSNVAQTTPQETLDQSAHSEDEPDSLNIELEHIQRLQQVAASDNARPPFYGEGGREYSDGAYMDDGNMTYGRNYDITQPNQNDDSYNDELMSMASSDPPGTSYRDLPPEDQDNFDSLFNHQVEDIPVLPHNNSNNFHSFQINHDDDGYESKSSSQGSRGSRGSRRSHRSNQVQNQQADLRYDDGNKQINDQHYDYQKYSNVNYVVNDALNEDQDVMPAHPYNENYQQDGDDNYQQEDAEFDDNYQQESDYYDQRGDYPQSNGEYYPPDDDYYQQQHEIDGGNNVNRDYMDFNHNSEEYIGEVDMDRSAFQPRIGFDEENYQFMPIQVIPFPTPAEELDEVSNSGSTSTQQRSNKSPRLGSQNHKRHEQQQEAESITSIFQSLSEIQTRLASKGKPTLSEGNLHDESTINNVRGDIIYAQHKVQQQIDDVGGGGGGWVGVVEDASVDGSQVSNFSSRVSRGQRPQQGQWIEPVDEEDYIDS